MHGYFWCRKRLKERLKTFVGGQFLMETMVETEVRSRVKATRETSKGLVFRGKIESCSIPDMTQKRVLIYFSWLCEGRFGLNELWQPIPKWVLLEPPLGSQHLDVEFTTYYFQRRKGRIKMWTTTRGEVCRFYQSDDPSNLRREGDEFVPCYEPSGSASNPED